MADETPVTTPRTLSSTALRADLGDVLDAVEEAGERVVVTRWGDPCAVLVSLADLARLERPAPPALAFEIVPALGSGMDP